MLFAIHHSASGAPTTCNFLRFLSTGRVHLAALKTAYPWLQLFGEWWRWSHFIHAWKIDQVTFHPLPLSCVSELSTPLVTALPPQMTFCPPDIAHLQSKLLTLPSTSHELPPKSFDAKIILLASQVSSLWTERNSSYYQSTSPWRFVSAFQAPPPRDTNRRSKHKWRKSGDGTHVIIPTPLHDAKTPFVTSSIVTTNRVFIARQKGECQKTALSTDDFGARFMARSNDSSNFYSPVSLATLSVVFRCSGKSFCVR